MRVLLRGFCWSPVGFRSTCGSLGRGINGVVRSPESGAAASMVAWMAGLVTQTCCLFLAGLPVWLRKAIVLIQYTRISPRHLSYFHLTF